MNQLSDDERRPSKQDDSDVGRWICVLVEYRYLITKGLDELGELFYELMGDDYITHHPLDPGEEPADDSASCYVLLCCHEYEPHLSKFANCPYLRGMLNSYKDVHEMSVDEVRSVRKIPSNVIHDGGHVVNRTGFFMPGDIVQVKTGPLSRIQGIVISQSHKNNYRIFFRLFMRSFTNVIAVHDLDFITSLFRYYKFPATRNGIVNSKKLAEKTVSLYRDLLQQQLGQQLVSHKEQ
jgi:hypothetical protein